MGGTDAFITTATMTVVTNWVHWVTALPETLGSWIWGYSQQKGAQNMSGCPWNDPEFRGATINRNSSNFCTNFSNGAAISGKEFYELHKDATTPERLSSDSAKRMA
jgi:hypothetical protein